MSWRQLTLQIEAQHAERLVQLVSEAGALAVTLRAAGGDALYEPAPGATPLWARTELSALFEAHPDLKHLLGEMKDALPALPPYHIEMLAEQDWVRLVQQDIKPLCFGGRLWVYPSHIAPPADSHIILDPGLAFGTGAHPTTALCLEWLATHEVTGHSVLDYGCGSGILALSAVKLGARHAWAVDHDPQALQATRDNARKNAIESRISAVAPPGMPDASQGRLSVAGGSLLRVPAPATLGHPARHRTPGATTGVDTLLANILATPLIELAPRLARRVNTGGRLVLSGILREQAEEVSAAYQSWCDVTLWAERDGWVCLDAVRKAIMV
jgi:ribosomal protein L11 methyltransferase